MGARLKLFGTLHYKTGERLSYVPRGIEIYMEKFGAVSRLIHRAELYQLLVDEVIDKKNVLGGNPGIDITNIVIEKLNKELPTLNLK